MQTPTPTPPTPHTVEALLRAIEQRDAEVVFLRAMVDKLELQLLRARRARFGSSSEQLDDPQMALLEGRPLDESPVPKAASNTEAANHPSLDRQLPAHLPRENQVHRPDATDDRLLNIVINTIGPRPPRLSLRQCAGHPDQTRRARRLRRVVRHPPTARRPIRLARAWDGTLSSPRSSSMRSRSACHGNAWVSSASSVDPDAAAAGPS